jgi:ketosteroid isomerase-like protein
MAKARLLAGLLVLGAGAAGWGAALPVAAQAQSAAAQNLPAAVERYALAWASRDAARIAALHTADSVFHLVIEGEPPVVGRAAIEARFARILADNPAYSSTPRAVNFGADFVVIEYDFVMAPARAFVMGERRYEPRVQAYSVPAIDVITFRGGLVARKVTYLDTAVIAANSGLVQ